MSGPITRDGKRDPDPSRARGRTGPIDDATRSRIVEMAQAGVARNDIARHASVGAGSVSRICAAAGVSFERQPARKATEARQVDQAARRTSLAGGLLDDLEDARRWLAEAEDSRALRDAANAVQSLAAAHARLATVPVNQDAHLDHAKSLLGQVAIGLQLRYGAGDTEQVAG